MNASLNGSYRLTCPGGRTLRLAGAPVLMGILNVTPDSFSDGGRFFEPAQAIAHGLQMLQDGAAVIDVGGESTRPGSAPVPPDEQIRRVVPVIAALRKQSDGFISIDTSRAAVAQAALDAGADIINDIAALRFDADLAALAAARAVPVILMHMQGTPGTMQQQPAYHDVIGELKAFFQERLAAARQAGIAPSQIILDPGIGFGKTVEHNLTILRRLHEFHELHCPLLVGPSRKSFIGKILGIDDPAQRLWGTAAAVAQCVAAGCHILRVHDVKEMAQVARLAAVIRVMKK